MSYRCYYCDYTDLQLDERKRQFYSIKINELTQYVCEDCELDFWELMSDYYDNDEGG